MAQSMETTTVHLVLAVHRCVDWEIMDPRRYWDRLTAVLQASARRSTSLGVLVERIRKGLQIAAPGTALASWVYSSRDLDGPARREIMRLLREETAYVVALTRAEVERVRAAREEEA